MSQENKLLLEKIELTHFLRQYLDLKKIIKCKISKYPTLQFEVDGMLKEAYKQSAHATEEYSKKHNVISELYYCLALNKKTHGSEIYQN